jgi:hypothetical protein
MRQNAARTLRYPRLIGADTLRISAAIGFADTQRFFVPNAHRSRLACKSSDMQKILCYDSSALFFLSPNLGNFLQML